MIPLPCGLSFNIVEAIIYFGIALTGLGVCAAYVDFITSTLPQVFSALDVTSTTLIVRCAGGFVCPCSAVVCAWANAHAPALPAHHLPASTHLLGPVNASKLPFPRLHQRARGYCGDCRHHQCGGVWCHTTHV